MPVFIKKYDIVKVQAIAAKAMTHGELKWHSWLFVSEMKQAVVRIALNIAKITMKAMTAPILERWCEWLVRLSLCLFSGCSE